MVMLLCIEDHVFILEVSSLADPYTALSLSCSRLCRWPPCSSPSQGAGLTWPCMDERRESCACDRFACRTQFPICRIVVVIRFIRLPQPHFFSLCM